jgi:hypothetical protein
MCGPLCSNRGQVGPLARRQGLARPIAGLSQGIWFFEAVSVIEKAQRATCEYCSDRAEKGNRRRS